MKQSKKLASLFAAASIAAAAPASAIVVGGINFGTLGETPSNIHLETATLAQQIITGNGQSSTAYGVISTVNGLNGNYCGAGSTADCALYYVANFSDSVNFAGGSVSFDTADVDIYFHNSSAANLLSQNSPANIAFIQGGTLWASLDGHADQSTHVLNASGSFSGATLNFAGAGLFDVVTGVGVAGVANYLDANGISDNVGGFADIALTSSANNFVLNPFDVSSGLTASCGTNTPVAGDWCFQGTANIRGNTQVPEPATLVLLAAGLGMLGFSRRSRQA